MIQKLVTKMNVQAVVGRLPLPGFEECLRFHVVVLAKTGSPLKAPECKQVVSKAQACESYQMS
jgi:hypothetical protein